MNFLTQQTEVANQLGLDQTQSNIGTLVKRWLNTSQRRIIEAEDWPFLRASSPLVVQTTADYTTGTVATTAGSTTATLSATYPTSLTNYYLMTSSSRDWYRITAHTAGTAALTLEIGAINTAAAATLTIRKFFYSTDATVDRILQIRQSVQPFELEEYTKERFNSVFPDPTATGSPVLYMMAGKDSSDIWQFALWPSPASKINLYIDYLLMVTDLSADADVSIIPSKWHTNIMIQGALWQGYNFLDDTRAKDAKMAFIEGIEEMKKNLLPSLHIHRKFQSIESFPWRNEFPLPLNYPNQ